MMQNVYEKICPGLVSGTHTVRKGVWRSCSACFQLQHAQLSLSPAVKKPRAPSQSCRVLNSVRSQFSFLLQFISLMSSFGKAGSWSVQGVFGWEPLQQIKLKPRWRQQSSSRQWCQTGSKWPTSSIWHWSLDLNFQYFSILSWAIV